MVNHPHQPYIIFAGLGNPGSKYEMTRHNMGYLVVRCFADKMGWNFKDDKRFQAQVAKGVVDGINVHLLLPTTYMNLSGLAVRSYLDFLKLEPSRLVVIIDDSALQFGDIRLKTMGSTGGHNGLKSVEEHLGTAHYMRLRMGIGSPGEWDLADYVLSPFTKEEFEHLEQFVNRGAEVLQHLLKESISQVMNKVNKSLTSKQQGSKENRLSEEKYDESKKTKSL